MRKARHPTPTPNHLEFTGLTHVFVIFLEPLAGRKKPSSVTKPTEAKHGPARPRTMRQPIVVLINN